MKLSVVIPCYNGAETIADQLEALANQHWSEPWEIVVADNGSTDESMTIVERYRKRLPNLRIADASARRAQPYALNVGARAAAGGVLAFCDADDVVGSGWVAAMGKALSEYDFVAGRFDIERLNAPWVQKSRGHPQLDGLSQYTYPPYLPHGAAAAWASNARSMKPSGGLMSLYLSSTIPTTAGGFNSQERNFTLCQTQ